MGVFPIIMNILQFWLIDSIVKAKIFAPALTLDPEEGLSADRQPLFRGSSDDEDDEDDRTHHVENASHQPHTDPYKPVPSAASQTHDENKSVGTSTPATGTSSRAGASFSRHAYPPRGGLEATLSGEEDGTSPTSSSSNVSKRRSPPPPLVPRSPLQPAINSPMVTPANARRASQTKAQIVSVEKPAPISLPVKDRVQEDDPWGEDWGDDWADRVGQEDWTGKRLEAARGFVGTAWHTQASPAIRVG
jgi:hypothetical protein